MIYEEQYKVQELNKKIIDDILQNVPAQEFIDFYRRHTRAETKAKYGIRTDKQLVKILKLLDYDFSTRKALNKGKPSARSHESYAAGGKKSSETQKASWGSKTDLEKQQWSEKQKIAHSSDSFKKAIKQINLDYWAALPEEKKNEIRLKKSKSAKEKWAMLSKDEQIAVMNNRFKNGRCYHAKDGQPNLAFATLLDKADISYEREFCLEREKFDFLSPDQKLLIEIDPTITHNTILTPFDTHPPIGKHYHADKTKLAEKYGYRCIHVFDWDDPEKIIKMLKRSETVYARECEIAEAPKDLAKAFLTENHLQGYAKDEIRLGLYHNGELISIMTFGKPRYNKNYDYELIRYCAKANVIGGAEKIFSHFLKGHPGASVISYCDLSKFSGQTYDKLGFMLLRSPAPSLHWSNYRTNEHFTDNLLRQQGFSRLVHHCDAEEDDLPTDDNKELMLQADFVPVYDCGQATYVYEAAGQTAE